MPTINVAFIPNRRSIQGRTASIAISVVWPSVIAVETQARGRPAPSR